MTPENQKKLDEKARRIQDAVALKEADRVPVNVSGGEFAVMEAGYTVAECIYDATLQKAGDALKKFLLKYDPDMGQGPVGYAGEGPIMELFDPTFMMWSGMPGNKMPDNSIQQFIEFPILLNEDFEQFFSDRTGWIMKKSMPSIANLLRPMADIDLPLSHRGLRQVCGTFSQPAVKDMLEKLWKADGMYRDVAARARVIARETVELGYPALSGGKAVVPFDEYSDTLRGTMLSLTDLYDNTEYMERYIYELFPQVIDGIKKLNTDGSRDGKIVHMMLHKGMDGFMSNEYYEKYYWKHLQEIIQTIADCGMIANVFAEGRYSSRLDFLKEVPKGKVIYAFEQTPMELAKKKLGGVACITGGFPNAILDFGTVQQTIDETKKIIDICAPGGGYIFRTNASLSNAKVENVEAMFSTIREYGKY